MKFHFFKYCFAVIISIKNRNLLLRGGVCWENSFYRTLENKKELVLYLPIPYLVKEGGLLKYRYVLTHKSK